MHIPWKIPYRQPPTIPWYRTPLDSKDFKSLHQRSDWKGGLQTFSFLGLILLTGGSSLYASLHGYVALTLLFMFLHGTVCSFLINAVHELGHNTVFKTKWLNSLFVRVFAFLEFFNFEWFNASHTRHHRYTLHQPDDLEVVLPLKVMFWNIIKQGIVNPQYAYNNLKTTIRHARGKFQGKWEQTLFPPGSPEARATINWARFLLVGHGLIFVFSMYFHLWILPLLTSFGTFYGTWLQFLCNNTQHVGLQDEVPDFRLCCRTFTMNRFVEFLYWDMNYHIEHHMYAAVPCYNLRRLHQLIKHDLPPCTHGLIATWKEISSIIAIQQTNPDYQHVAPLPGARLREKASRRLRCRPEISRGTGGVPKWKSGTREMSDFSNRRMRLVPRQAREDGSSIIAFSDGLLKSEHSGIIPPEIVEQVRHACDIVDVIPAVMCH